MWEMDKTTAQGELLLNRLVKRHRHLRKWAKRVDTNAFRLYDRDIPEIPLILDLYGDSVSGALYKRPYEKDDDEENLWLDAMKEAVSRALDIPIDNIFFKTRRRQRGNSQYTHLTSRPFWRDAWEEGLKFRVNLSDYLDTGLFLDARKRRALIRSEAKGLRVLNLFSYTCSLSVCAAAGGALEVDSVDMSRTYLEWAAHNFHNNGFSASQMDEREFFRNSSQGHRLIRADALDFLQEATRRRLFWDLIILDPPSFSNSKKMKTHLDIRRDHKALIQSCLKILSPKGKLYFSANARNFRLDPTEFPRLEIHDITENLRDEDFRGKKIPPCYIVKR